MYLYNAYYNYATIHRAKPIARYNHLALFQKSDYSYIIVNLLTSAKLYHSLCSLSVAEAKLMELYNSEPLVIMADLEFCDLEYNDSILTNPTAFICEALASNRAISIKPKAL